MSAEQSQRRLLQEYQAKLTINGDCLDDPFTITTGWTGEKDGITKWPSVYIMDISDYLNTKNPEELMKRLLNEYKEGKAYRYFTGDWVKEICYHNINSNSDKCVVKSKVTPSQAVNNKAYDVWVVLKKDTGNIPGGQVLRAYCTCTAGMLGSCNHIAGVLFRLEHAVKTGMTRPASTSKPSVWTIPKKKTKINPGKVTDLIWKKSHYTKLPSDLEKENEKSAKKKCFTPLNKTQEKKVQDGNKMRLDLHKVLKEDIPNSCFTLLMDKRRISVKESQEESIPVPDTLIDVAQQVPREGFTLEERKREFLSQIELSEAQVNALNSATITQSNSEKWKEHRRGRVTASIFHRICLRTKSLRKSSKEDPSSVIKTVMGSTQSVQTKSMKHGISTEPIAKRAYNSTMKRQHTCLTSQDTGMFVLKEKPFISVSPDLLVQCKCCGEGLCEIKCPDSIKGLKPSPENVPYISVSDDNTISLKKNHPYFYQIQGQMGVTGRHYCDFFVFTFHGHICVRVMFNESFFSEMIEDITWFWEKYIIDELLKNEQVLKEKDTNEEVRAIK